MAAHATCDTCAIVVSTVLCDEHRDTRCDRCKVAADELLCSSCADDEYGDDGAGREPNEEDLADFIEHAVVSDDVGDLAAAIRRGDMVEAEYLLDKVAALVPGWSDRVSLGRYSPMARAA